MKKILLSVITLFVFSFAINAQTYLEITGTPFIDGFNPAMEFFDMDNDNDLDVIICANSQFGTTNAYTKLYSNNGSGAYTEVTGPFEAVAQGDISIGDIDGDGDNDMIIQGKTQASTVSTKVYLNNGSGTFSIMPSTGLPNLFGGEIRLADVDSDSDLDLVLGGFQNPTSPFNSMTKLYFNNGNGVFTESTTSTFDAINRDIQVYDFDLDGDKDIMISGYSSGSSTKFYLNNGSGMFTLSTTNIIHTGDIGLIDHNGDNYMDVLIAGHLSSSQGTAETVLYTNNGSGNFTAVSGNSFPLFTNAGEMAIYDYDDDNDEDVVFIGWGDNTSVYHGKMFHNNGSGSFSENTTAGLVGGRNANVAIGDIDNDNKVEILFIGYGCGTTLYSETACVVNIPDANFKAALVGNGNINTNFDSEIQCSEAADFTGQLNISNASISDLTGIEAFVNISSLNCANNSLTSLDLSANTGLTDLYCNNNALTSLNISANTNLTILGCRYNNLSNLDLSTNTNLETVICADNNLTSLTTSSNALTYLYCAYNSISNLDVSASTNLESLYCHSNSLTGINFSQNTNLETLDINTNSLSSLDLSSNVNLSDLDCTYNSLSGLDLSSNSVLTELSCYNNSLTSLNVANGNNTNLSVFSIINNPNLSCVTVDNVAYSTANWTSAVSYSLNCNVSNPILVSSILVQGQGGVFTITTNGGTLQMLATVLPNNADDGTYTWSISSGGANASITSSGVLQALNNGTVTVAATANDGSNVQGFATITISNQGTTSPILVSSITVQGQGGISTITTNGGTLQMLATVLPNNADDGTYTWSVVNGTGAATIDANGLLTATADGTVDVIATANDASGITGTKTITISNQSVGINDVSFENVSIYPNPTTNILNIEIAERLTSIRIMDISGRTVQVFNPENTQLDISDLTSGIYFLEIANAEKKSILKIIKK